MERVGVGLTCLPPVPDYIRNIPSVFDSRIRNDSYLYLSVPHVESEACAEVLKSIQEGDLRYVAYNFAVIYKEEDWFNPDRRWVAAILDGDDVQRMIPDNTFAEPRLPPPCFGIVPPDQPIHVNERPRGDVVAIEDDCVFSSRIYRLLISHAPATLGQVIYRGQVLEKWHRFFPQEERAVIADSTFGSYYCAACGTQGRHAHQAYVGRVDPNLTVAREKVGLSHLNLRRPYLISLEIAAELRRKLRGEYTFGLQPILDADSDVGQAILRAAPILNTHQLPRPVPQK